MTLYFPVRRGAAVDPRPLALRSRFGGPPWLSARGGHDALRPRAAGTRRACPLLLQLALDELPQPPVLPAILLQIFVPDMERSAGRVPFFRVTDGLAGEGERSVGRSALGPEHDDCAKTRYEAVRAD